MFHEFFRPEESSQERVDAKRLEEVLRDQDAGNRKRLAISDQFEIVRCSKGEVAAYRLKRAVLFLEVLSGIRRIGFGGFTGFGIFLYNAHKLLRIAKRKGAQQNGVHHAEDGDIRANAERENQDGDSRKSAVAPHGAKRKAQILHEHVEPRQPARLAMLLKRLLHPAELNQCLPARLRRGQAAPKILFDRHFEV